MACEHCAAIHREVILQPNETAACGRCGALLQRYSRLTPHDWLALTLAALVVFLIANAFPVASVAVQGQVRSATLGQAVILAWQTGHPLVAALCGLVAIVLPGLQILLLLHILVYLCLRRTSVDLISSLRLLGWIRPWSMVPVFVLAVLVALVKLAGLASVELQPGMAGFAILTILITMLGRLTPRLLWRLAERERLVAVYQPAPRPGQALTACHACGQVQPLPGGGHRRCLRCQAALHWRKPDWLARSWALLLTAAILYLPANLLPIMVIDSPLLGNSQHTILGGVIELARLGSWDLALIVFIASFVVPLGKMLALACLLLATQWRWRGNLAARGQLYRVVEFVGQWSMLDVFVVLLLTALAHFSGLMTIEAGVAAGAFGMVVVLTMLSAMAFDPRVGWDYAQPAPLSDPSSPPASSCRDRNRSPGTER
ncbi:MAG: paraquat-inducible protein A [Pigmentiphaga sp.]|nr:paraquat-inducible protein A [Pigmentiphaga sp.]